MHMAVLAALPGCRRNEVAQALAFAVLAFHAFAQARGSDKPFYKITRRGTARSFAEGMCATKQRTLTTAWCEYGRAVCRLSQRSAYICPSQHWLTVAKLSLHLAALLTSGCSGSKCQEPSRPNGNHAIAHSPGTRQLTCTSLRYVDVRQDVCLSCLQLPALSLPRGSQSRL